MKDDTLRQRRNVMGTAIALSIYQMIGAEPKDEFTFIGTFKVANPELLITVMWLALAYFIWRFWLHVRPDRTRCTTQTHAGYVWNSAPDMFQYNFLQSLGDLPGYQELAEDKLKGEGVTDINPLAPILGRTLFTRKLDYSFLLPAANGTRGAHGNALLHVIPISYWSVFMLELKAFFIAALRTRSFSDYELPYYVAAVPFIIYVFHNLVNIKYEMWGLGCKFKYLTVLLGC